MDTIAWMLELLNELDHRILLAARDLPSWLLSLFHLFTVIGAGWGMFALVPFLIKPTTRHATVALIGAILLTSGAGNVIKTLVGRIRPCDALGWCSPLRGESPGGWSFPSGHAAGSFAFAAFILLCAPRYAPLALMYALLVASSRFVLGVHYPTDVFGGAILGSLIGAACAVALRRHESRRQAARRDPRAPDGSPTEPAG